MESKRIGFISTRLSGTDGVSLETRKWAHVLEREGHKCFFMAGELDTPSEASFLVPTCHFTDPAIQEVSKNCFGCTNRTSETTQKIEKLKHALKQSIRDFIDKFDLDLIIPENALTIPLNLPLGLAITEVAIETNIPMIVHNHDFFWERKRFLRNGCWDYLNKAFPPNLPMVKHAVLNSSQDNQLSLRKGISAMVIPNVMDYKNPPPPPDGYADDLRDRLGMKPDEKFILQPTRIVKRKGIEHAIELLHRLKMPAKLVISHAFGDEGDDYSTRVKNYSDLLGVETLLCDHLLAEERGTDKDGNKLYTLADFYSQADLVTYPSSIEGFGNAFLEAVYYRVPLIVNNYSVYSFDIKPKGFRTIEIDDYVHDAAVEQTREVLNNPELGAEMTAINYELGKRYFSFEILQQSLCTLMIKCFGAE
ncbi:MAG: glycosyltransferase family 4 protein [Kiritimatiellae bacterium]|nr:glycosyltransferase family 4 protein [Kiritimatiellia bacterium]